MAEEKKIELENVHREQIAVDKMLEAARIEFEAACWRGDEKRLEAARVKLTETILAWSDITLARVSHDIRKLTGQ